MNTLSLFPFADYWWFYGLFTLAVLGFLALDLGVFHRKTHEVRFREALTWSAVWISLALTFALGLWQYGLWKFPQDPRLLAAGLDAAQAKLLANQTAIEFLTGFLVEKSLSVDNLFVFLVVFSFFGVPAQYQHKVLFYGVLGALVFRVIFITVGAALLQWHWMLWLFGGFLALTGIKLLFAPEKPIDPERNVFIRLLRRLMPVTPGFEGDRFLVRKAGILHATPLLVALVFTELTDILFAVDSVPAIFALTKEPLVVFTSNIFAILGLRALYFLLAGVMHRFWALKYALGLILVFVGAKMALLNELAGGKFPVTWSLGIIGGLLAGSVILSLLKPRKPVPTALPSTLNVSTPS
jgi:tellurite resistance protein TerC